MARGSSLKRKIKAWTRSANHGQKPARHKKRGWPRYKEILEIRKNKG